MDVETADVHPFAVYVTVYWVVADGLTVLLEFIPPFDHANVPPEGDPVARSVAGDPAQIVWFVLVNVGKAFTVTVDADAVDAQPFAV